MKKKIVFLLTICFLFTFEIFTTTNPNSLIIKEFGLNSLLVITHANAEDESGCKVDCDNGYTASIPCSYHCVASTSNQLVRCFDADHNLLDEQWCSDLCEG